jgi:hypothetical protein
MRCGNTPRIGGPRPLTAMKPDPVTPISPSKPAPVQIAVTASAAARDTEQQVSSRAAATSGTTGVTANQNAQGFGFLNKFVIFKYIPFSFPRWPAFFVKTVTVFKPIPADLPTNQLTAFRVQPWFGGTSLPPNTPSLYLKLNCWWNSI